MGKRLCGQRTVSVRGRDAEDQRTDLPAALARSAAVDARTGRQVGGGCGVQSALYDAYQHSAQVVGEGSGYRQAILISHEPAHVCDDDAHARGRPIHDFETARAYGREDDAGLCQDHQSEERRGGQSREWIVRLKQFSILRVSRCFFNGAVCLPRVHI